MKNIFQVHFKFHALVSYNSNLQAILQTAEFLEGMEMAMILFALLQTT